MVKHTIREHVYENGQMWDRNGQSNHRSQDIMLTL